jgi:hypothetical protein
VRMPRSYSASAKEAVGIDQLETNSSTGSPRSVALTGLDPVAIWEWGVVERLSTGLLCTQISLQPLGRDTLRAAAAVTDLTM